MTGQSADVRQVAVTGGEITCTTTGQGPPIVFVHPLLASPLHWRKVVPIVADAGFACVTPALPLGAHATAMRVDADLRPPAVARMIVEVVEALELGPVTLVGNDSGGALAQIVAARRPDVVARLVLTSCDSLEHFFPPLFRYLSWAARVPRFATVAAGALQVRPLRRTPLAFGWLAKYGVPDDVVDAYLQPLRADAGVRRDVTKFVRAVSNRYTLEAANHLRSFASPALVAWAREDRVFSPSLARRLAALLPNARLAWIDDSYAFTPEDQPEVLAGLIVGFCGERSS